MIQRGGVYDIQDAYSGGTLPAVIVTVDRWNAVMSSVGVLFVGPPEDDDTARTPVLHGPEVLQVTVGHLVIVRTELVKAERFRMPDAPMRRIEDGLRDLLLLPHLCGPSPRAPRPLAGPVDYPRWGQVYYLTGETAEHGRLSEPKRFVVVSADDWNAQDDYVLAVRLTSQPKQPPTVFPNVGRGASRACCGDLTAVAASQLSPRRRPTPQTLSLTDMVAVARGIAVTHGLG